MGTTQRNVLHPGIFGNLIHAAMMSVVAAKPRKTSATVLELGALGGDKSVWTGPGRVTVFTHHNYIHDSRRKWYGLGGRWP